MTARLPSILREPVWARYWLVALLALGCRPQIGDKCEISTDCSQVGDRLCDVSQPDGYCTIYNCEPKASNGATKCPDGAVCIAFAAEPSPVPGCANRLGDTPYSRTFCMKECDNTTDCRDGYVCLDLGAPGNRWAAVDVDGPGKVCTQAFSAAFIPPRSPAICSATDTTDGGGDPNGTGGAGSDGDTGAGGTGATSSGGMGGA